jgi:LysM repeat protein
VTHSSLPHLELDDVDDYGQERVLNFPERPRRTMSRDVRDEMEPSQEPGSRRHHRRRRRPVSTDSTPRYIVTAVGAILAVAVLVFLVNQIAQIGQQAIAPGAGPSAGVPLQPDISAAQPASAQVPNSLAPRGQGSIKVSSRTLEPSYSVVAGDTLGTIAAKSGASVEALQGLNNLSDRNSLAVGQKLVIPD